MTDVTESTGALWRQVQAEQAAAALQPGDAEVIIPLEQIDASDRLREIDPAWAQVIADSAKARLAAIKRPLINPVTVRPNPGGDKPYKLVSGGHRFAAMDVAGLGSIQAIVRQANDLEARLEEIDENLVRRELSAFDRAAFLAERKRLYEELYPQAKRGKKGALSRWHDATGKLPLAFTEDAATRAGLDVSVVRKILKTWELLTPATRDRVRGTWLADNDSQLKALSKCGPELQAKVLDAMLREDGPAANVAAALAEVENRQATVISPEEAAFAALVKAWDRAEGFPKARARFLEHAGLQAAAKAKPARKAQAEQVAA